MNNVLLPYSLIDKPYCIGYVKIKKKENNRDCAQRKLLITSWLPTNMLHISEPLLIKCCPINYMIPILAFYGYW